MNKNFDTIEFSGPEDESLPKTADSCNNKPKQKCSSKLKTCFKSFKFHSVIVYIILLSLISLFTAMIQGGYLSATMTSLQTQFNLSTSKVGFILSSYDIMGVFATPLVSYIGSKLNKCRIIGICGFFYVLGAVIYTLPYYLAERYKIPNIIQLNETSLDKSVENIDMCKSSNYISGLTTSFFYSNQTTTTSLNSQDLNKCNRGVSSTWPYAVFIIGQMLMSLGAAPLFSLGITYLCDNLEERLHALYTGIVYGAFALGPAIGYLTASFLLSKWVYLDESPPVKDSHPKWVGCWFMGYIIAAGLVFILSILLMSFPDKIPIDLSKKHKQENNSKKRSSKKSRKQDPNENNNNNNDNNDNNFVQKRVLHTIDEANEIVDKNFEFLDTVSSRVSSGLELTPPQSNSTDSFSTISNSTDNIKSKKKPSCSAKLIDRIKHSKLKFRGFLSSLLKLILNLRYTLLILIMSIECILVALFTNYMILYSQNIYQISSSRSSILVGGVIVPSAILGAILGGFIVRKFDLYIEGCVRLIILSSCVVVGGIFVLLFIRCEGTSSEGIDLSKQSFNKSFIGCLSNCDCMDTYRPTCGINKKTYVSPCYAGCKTIDPNGYYNCSCINPNNNNDNRTSDAIPGACSRNCDSKLVIFLIVLFIVVAFEALSLTPATMLVLKLIDNKQLQPFALGLLRCANILLAYIPAPIVLSQVIDRTCILWNNQCEGDKGTCLEYNTFDFHFVLFGGAAGIKIVSSILLVIFTIYIHKSFFMRRKYRKKATLNHDPSFVLSPKQKYRIDSVVASSETSSMSSDDTSSLRTLYRKPIDKLKRNNSLTDSVTLKKHVILEDENSLAKSQSSADFFTNLEQLNSSLSTDKSSNLFYIESQSKLEKTSNF